MLAWVRVTAVNDDQETPDYYLAKFVDFATVPVPATGDTLYVDGVFLDVKSRCISPQSKDDDGDYRIELYTTAPVREFKELEEERGWKPD